MKTRFEILFSEGVQDDLQGFRAYDRHLILDAIEMHLRHRPNVETKKRRLLHNLAPPFEAIPPIWQLRVGTFRVFYDVGADDRRVSVRAIRRKSAHKTTEEIL